MPTFHARAHAAEAAPFCERQGIAATARVFVVEEPELSIELILDFTKRRASA